MKINRFLLMMLLFSGLALTGCQGFNELTEGIGDTPPTPEENPDVFHGEEPTRDGKKEPVEEKESDDQHSDVNRFEPSITVVEADDRNITFEYNLMNNSDETQSISFSSDGKFDYRLTGEKNDSKIIRSEETTFAETSIEEQRVAANDNLSFQFTLQDLSEDIYQLVVWLTHDGEEEYKVTMDFEIVHDNEVVIGTFIGLADTRSVEIEVEGTRNVYRLSSDAMKQLDQINEGDTVTFYELEGDDDIKGVQHFIFD